MSDSPEIKEVLDLRAEVANCRALLEEQRQQYADKCLELIDLREAKLREKQPLTRWTITGEEPDEENQRPGTMATPDPNGEWVSISDVHSLGTAYGALCQELEAVKRERDEAQLAWKKLRITFEDSSTTRELQLEAERTRLREALDDLARYVLDCERAWKDAYGDEYDEPPALTKAQALLKALEGKGGAR